MPATPVKIDNFRGGWSTNEPTTIEDNELSEAQNVYYDENGYVRSRAGTLSFGETVPDSAIVVHNMDTYDGNGTWTGSEDAVSVATDSTNHYLGAGAVKFNIDVSNDAANTATITNSSGMTQVDLSSAGDTGEIRMILKTTGTVANFTGIRLRWGSDSTNYYEKTVTTQASGIALVNGKNVLGFDWATATTTGSPVDTAIDYLQIQIQYSASQGDMTALVVDQIAWVSATSSKKNISCFGYKESSQTSRLLNHTGTVLWIYEETQALWTPILTGLAETKGKWAVYKDVAYYVNGTDHVSFNGKAAAENAHATRLVDIFVRNDVAYGYQSNSSDLLYTSAGPADLLPATFSNTDPIDDDNGQVLRGIGNIGDFIIALKDKSAYKFSTSGPAYSQIDAHIGTTAFDSVVGVENNLLFLGHDGDIYNAYAIDTTDSRTKADPLSKQLKEYTVGFKNLSNCTAIEWKPLNNVYFAVDPEDTGVNTEVLVINTRLSSLENNKAVFTRYVGINANDFTIWEDSSNVEHLLVANAFGGQMLEMETGADDDGSEIEIDVKTKAYEFNESSIIKYINNIDGVFHATDGATFQFDAIGDEVNSTIGGALVSVDAQTSETSAIGVNPIGVDPIGGKEVDTLRRLKRRLPVYTATGKVQVQFTDLLQSHTFILEKITIEAQVLARSLFATNSIL